MGTTRFSAQPLGAGDSDEVRSILARALIARAMTIGFYYPGLIKCI
jgi:hypothetical protein